MDIITTLEEQTLSFAVWSDFDCKINSVKKK